MLLTYPLNLLQKSLLKKIKSKSAKHGLFLNFSTEKLVFFLFFLVDFHRREISGHKLTKQSIFNIFNCVIFDKL